MGADLADDGHFMGDHHDGDAQPPVDVLQKRQDRLGGHGIQRAGGLVAEQHLRIGGQGAGDGHALLLAAGELRGIGVRLVRQAHDLQQLLHAPVGLLPRHMGQLQRIAHVLRHGGLHQQVELLKDHAHALAQLPQLPRVHVEDVLPVHQNPPGCGRLQPVHAADQRGLARAAQADDAEDLALLHVQAHVAHRVHFPALGDECLGHIFQFQHRHTSRYIAKNGGCAGPLTAASPCEFPLYFTLPGMNDQRLTHTSAACTCTSCRNAASYWPLPSPERFRKNLWPLYACLRGLSTAFAPFFACSCKIHMSFWPLMRSTNFRFNFSAAFRQSSMRSRKISK